MNVSQPGAYGPLLPAGYFKRSRAENHFGGRPWPQLRGPSVGGTGWTKEGKKTRREPRSEES